MIDWLSNMVRRRKLWSRVHLSELVNLLQKTWHRLDTKLHLYLDLRTDLMKLFRVSRLNWLDKE